MKNANVRHLEVDVKKKVNGKMPHLHREEILALLEWLMH